MPLPPSLDESFYAWGLPKLRGLQEAHEEDKKAGVKRYGALYRATQRCLQEFETMPFAQPTFEEYLDEDGNPTLSVATIRSRALSWFRNHARADKSKQVTKFEAGGGISERPNTRATSAAELWAEGEKPRIRRATCEALGIPVSTGNNALPSEWIGARKAAVKREFAMLPEADQEEWHALAREEKQLAAKDQASVISIQERQKAFPSWFDSTLGKKVKGGAMGDTFSIQFTGYFVREEDRQLERFRGQINSGDDAASWFDSEVYKQDVGPAWTKFIHAEVADKVAPVLPKIEGDTSESLKDSRARLIRYLEEMFRLACNFNSLDLKAFWKDIIADPDRFISPARLPEDLTFEDLTKMQEDDFCELYKHLWRCQHRPNTVTREARFMYESEAVRDYVMLERAQHLKREQHRRARKSAARNSAGTASSKAASDVPPPISKDGIAPPAPAPEGGSASASPPRASDDERSEPARANVAVGTAPPPSASGCEESQVQPVSTAPPPSASGREESQVEPVSTTPPPSASGREDPPVAPIAQSSEDAADGLRASQPPAAAASVPLAGPAHVVADKEVDAPSSKGGRARSNAGGKGSKKNAAAEASKPRRGTKRPSNSQQGDGDDDDDPSPGTPEAQSKSRRKKPRVETTTSSENPRYPTRRKAAEKK